MAKDFTFRLIKGKIAEIIFAQMFSEVGEFTVIPFGYESILPEIVQHQRNIEYREVINAIKDSPDFVLISQDKTKLFLVEVKYRSALDQKAIVEDAEEVYENWKPAWLFVATPHGFYFDSCSNIAKNKDIKSLSETWIPKKLQEEYLEVLNRFRCE